MVGGLKSLHSLSTSRVNFSIVKIAHHNKERMQIIDLIIGLGDKEPCTSVLYLAGMACLVRRTTGRPDVKLVD